MAPNLLLYRLLLVALVLICLLIHVEWPDNPSATSKTSLKPDKPRRKRSTEPKPFTGLLHKPLCEACEKAPMHDPKRRAHRLLCSSSPGDACAPSTRLSISVRITIASITGGSAMATSARMGIRAASPGASCSASPARAISMKPMAQSSRQARLGGAHRARHRVSGRGFGHPRHGAGLRDRSQYGTQLVGGGRRAAQSLFGLFSARVTPQSGPLDELYAVLSAVRDGDVSEAEAIERLSRVE